MFGSTTLVGRLAAVGAAAVVAGTCVAGCTSSPASSSSAAAPATSSAPEASAPASASTAAPASATASPRAVTAPASASASQPAATAASPSAGGAGSTAAAACASRDLAAHVGLAQGTAGSIYQVIYFTNLSNAPCTLYGYPGVSLAGGSPQVNQVGAAASRSTATAPALVTVAPGRSANALLRIVEAGNYPTGTCKPAATTFLQIYPPGQTTPIYLAYNSTGCALSAVNLLSISVLTPGTGG